MTLDISRSACAFGLRDAVLVRMTDGSERRGTVVGRTIEATPRYCVLVDGRRWEHVSGEVMRPVGAPILRVVS